MKVIIERKSKPNIVVEQRNQSRRSSDPEVVESWRRGVVMYSVCECVLDARSTEPSEVSHLPSLCHNESKFALEFQVRIIS